MRLQTVVFSVLLGGLGLAPPLVVAQERPQAAVEQQRGQLASEFEALLATARTESRVPLALRAVYAMQRLAPFMDFAAYRAAITDAARSAKNPLVKFQLLQLVARAAVDAQDPAAGPRGSALLAGQACLTQWSLVGPFANDNMDAMATPLGPETGVLGPFVGKTVEVAWRDLPPFDRQCEFWLNQVVEPDSAAVVYLSTEIDVDRAQKGSLLLGTHGAYKVYLNGVLVGENKDDFGMSPDNDGWKVSFKKGKNTVLLKLGSTGSGTLGAVVRAVDANLQPLKFSYSTADSTPRYPAASPVNSTPKTTADPRAVRAQTASLAQSKNLADALHAAWLWKEISSKDVSTPWRNVAERVLAESSALSPRQHALVADLYEEESRQLAILEAALQRAPDDPFVATRLGTLYDGGLTEPRQLEARNIFERVVRRHGDFLPAWLALSGWYRARGFNEKAYALLYEAPAQGAPALVTRQLGLNGDLGTHAEKSRLQELALRFSFSSGSEVWDHVRTLSAQGKHADALALIQAWRQNVPLSVGGARHHVYQLRALGLNEEALAVWSDLIAQRPGDADLFKERAELLVALGRDDEARADIEAALVRRPQDQFLRDYAAFLKPQENRFWDTWVVDDVRDFASKVAPTPFNYDTLVDQSVVFVAPNGLSQHVQQRVERVQTADGIEAAKHQQIAFQAGDERVDVLRVRVYKADGTVSEDFDQWESGGSRKASTTYNDTTYVNVRANNVGVGDLVEVQWRLSQVANANFRGDYFGDIQYLQSGRPIAFARYAVLYPSSWELFFRVPSLPHTRTDDVMPGGDTLPEGFRVTAFDLKNVPYVQTDPDQPGATDVYDYLLVSNKKTWDDIGNWWWNLIKEQLIVDDEMRAEVRRLTRNAKTVEDKVRAIHNYVVRNTRYLHVGLGIHGWKPYRTTTAFRNRYGDCKDKAALLKVMLEEAGVEAEMVLVRTRTLGQVDDFPASMHVFNHAITYVPALDLYLDGTAEFNGTRELTPMDQGAQALIVKDGGATKFLGLPVDKADQNVMQFRLDVDLTSDVPVASGSLKASGVNAVYFRSILEDPERRNEEFEKFLGSTYPGARLLKATYSDLAALEKDVSISFSFESPQLLKSDGAREFVLPVGTHKDLVSSYAKQAKRSQDLDIRVPFTAESVLKFKIPRTKNYSTLPRDVQLNSRFGALDVKFTQTGSELEASVIYRIDVQRVAVEDYAEFRKFVAEMNDALNQAVTLGETP